MSIKNWFNIYLVNILSAINLHKLTAFLLLNLIILNSMLLTFSYGDIPGHYISIPLPGSEKLEAVPSIINANQDLTFSDKLNYAKLIASQTCVLEGFPLGVNSASVVIEDAIDQNTLGQGTPVTFFPSGLKRLAFVSKGRSKHAGYKVVENEFPLAQPWKYAYQSDATKWGKDLLKQTQWSLLLTGISALSFIIPPFTPVAPGALALGLLNVARTGLGGLALRAFGRYREHSENQYNAQQILDQTYLANIKLAEDIPVEWTNHAPSDRQIIDRNQKKEITRESKKGEPAREAVPSLKFKRPFSCFFDPTVQGLDKKSTPEQVKEQLMLTEQLMFLQYRRGEVEQWLKSDYRPCIEKVLSRKDLQKWREKAHEEFEEAKEDLEKVRKEFEKLKAKRVRSKIELKQINPREFSQEFIEAKEKYINLRAKLVKAQVKLETADNRVKRKSAEFARSVLARSNHQDEQLLKQWDHWDPENPEFQEQAFKRQFEMKFSKQIEKQLKEQLESEIKRQFEDEFEDELRFVFKSKKKLKKKIEEKMKSEEVQEQIQTTLNKKMNSEKIKIKIHKKAKEKAENEIGDMFSGLRGLLWKAVKNGDVVTVQKLLNIDVIKKVKKDDGTKTVVVKSGVDLHSVYKDRPHAGDIAYKLELIQTAVKQGNVQVLEALMKKNGFFWSWWDETGYDFEGTRDLDTKENLMHVAVAHGSKESVKWLLENGKKGQLMQRDSDKNTPLHIAIQKRQFAILIQLLESRNKVDLDKENNAGKTIRQELHDTLEEVLGKEIPYKAWLVSHDRDEFTRGLKKYLLQQQERSRKKTVLERQKQERVRKEQGLELKVNRLEQQIRELTRKASAGA